MVKEAPPLEVRNLSVLFTTEDGHVKAVDDVSFALEEGKTTCLVGESGCGKSVTALSILKLVPPRGRIVGGEVFFKGRELLSASEKELRLIRGKELSIIFQEHVTALNPVYPVGYQVMEVIRTHQGLSRRAARSKAVQVLETVGMSGAANFDAYAHELSGGMCQRVMIAMALSCRPAVLVADEPTTALDVTIQAQVLDLLARFQQDLGMSVLLITHDLSVVAEVADKVIVMYAGQVVEQATTKQLFEAPAHPYTKALLRSIPKPPPTPGRRLAMIPGTVPGLAQLPQGCRFSTRCVHAFEPCMKSVPELWELDGSEHWARCFLNEPK